MPRGVVGFLGSVGIRAHTAESRGWGGLTNGALVDAAVEAGFACLLTRDRLFSESAARALRRFPQFSVVLVMLPQLRGPHFQAAFQMEWGREPIRPPPGRLLRWPVV